MKKVLTPDEVAAVLSLKRRTIVQWLESGKLQGIKVGNRWRVKEEELDRFINEPNIYFADYVHHRRFEEIQSIARGTDRQLVSCVYVLACLHKPLDEFISHGKVDTAGIKNAAKLWGGVDRALVEVAVALYDDEEEADINDIFPRLDHKGIQVLMQALRLRW